MKTKLFHTTVSMITLAALLAGLLVGLPLQAAQAASAAPAPQQTSFDCANVTQIPQLECQALVAFYNSTNGLSWDSQGGWLSTTTPCSWYDVSCNSGKTHVTMLYVSQNNLTGGIPAEIAGLTYLTYLDLSGSNFSGGIPAALGSLPNLNSIYLSRSNLSGPIPAELGSMPNLHYLDLSHNQLSGSIPSTLNLVPHLYDLDLSYNQLNGSIPPGLGNIAQPIHIHLNNNQLVTTQPSWRR